MGLGNKAQKQRFREWPREPRCYRKPTLDGASCSEALIEITLRCRPRCSVEDWFVPAHSTKLQSASPQPPGFAVSSEDATRADEVEHKILRCRLLPQEGLISRVVISLQRPILSPSISGPDIRGRLQLIFLKEVMS